jgi:hypothetical protein
MSICIEIHAIFHEKKEIDPKKAKAERNKIEEQLTQKVIIKIAHMKIASFNFFFKMFGKIIFL